MLSEWSTECSVDDPVLVVPWSNEDGSLHWVDLRAEMRDDPEFDDGLDEIHEADAHPALLGTLRTLNAARSPVFTAKCDVWSMDEDELSALRMDLMLDDGVAEAGITSYIDLLWRERRIFTSRHQAEQLLHRLDRLAGELPHSLAKLECILRPAVIELDGVVQEGYAVSLYVKGCGVDASEAETRWGAALRDVARLLRSRDMSLL